MFFLGPRNTENGNFELCALRWHKLRKAFTVKETSLKHLRLELIFSNNSTKNNNRLS